MAKRAPRPGEGRPTIYNKELGDKICQLLAEGESLRSICRRKEMPALASVMKWVLDKDKEEFSEQYRHAREVQAENMFDEILEIADDGTNDFMTITKGDETYNTEDREVTNRSKLRVNARQWYLSKVLPKKFGEKVDVTSGGEKVSVTVVNYERNNNTA